MEKAVLFSSCFGLLPDAIYLVCHGHEHEHPHPMSPECIPVFWRVSGRDPVRQHEAGGSETASETGGQHPEPAV